MEVFLGLLVAALVGFFVYKDAKTRGMNAIGWGLGSFLVMFPVLIIYFIIRKERI